MDAHLQAIYDNTPEDGSRSRLEPYRELILLWRRQGRSYRRIQHLLDEKCNVSIAYEPLRRFVQRRSRPRRRGEEPNRKVNPSEPVEKVETGQQPEPIVTQPGPLPTLEQQNKVDRWAEMRQRMAQHKAQPVVEQKPWWKPQLEFTDEDAVKPLYSASKKEEK
jgi:hypothetical protein